MPEDGFAPLIVTVIIIVVLSLLTLGFVALVNNSKENALTAQLNNDAYYAAESGVNDALEAIANGYSQSKNSCPPLPAGSPQAGAQYLENNIINTSTNNLDYYPCLLINFTPSTLVYSNVGSTNPTVALLTTVSQDDPSVPAYPTDLVFSWEPSAESGISYPYAFAHGSLRCSPTINGPCLPPADSWKAVVGATTKQIAGILRVALTPLQSGSLSYIKDTSTTYTSFLYPLSGTGAVSTDTTLDTNSPGSTVGSNSGWVASGNCSNANPDNNPDKCTVDIPIDPGPGSNPYYGFIMSMMSLYTSSQVTIEAFQHGTQLLFSNAQTMIDSTGSDHGVLKRIQVRIPTVNDTGFAGYGAESTNSICKDMFSYPANPNTGNAGQAGSPCLGTLPAPYDDASNNGF